MNEHASIRTTLRDLLATPRSEVQVITYLEEYVARNPGDHEALLWYGDSLRLVGRCRQAAELLQSQFGSVADAKNKAAFAVRIAMALQGADPSRAERWFDIAAHLDPEAPGWMWMYRGVNLAVLQRFDAAIECYLVAARSKEVATHEAYKNLGLAYRAKGNYGQAKQWLLRAQEVTAAGNTVGLQEIAQVLEDLRQVEHSKQLAAALAASGVAQVRH